MANSSSNPSLPHCNVERGSPESEHLRSSLAEAARLARGILEAARYFHDRLPEAFSGLPRTRTRFPVEYPTSCSPQAWSTGAPLLLLRVLLGLEPIGGRLLVDAAVPKKLGRIELLDIPGRWGHADAFGRGRLSDMNVPASSLESFERIPVPIAHGMM